MKIQSEAQVVGTHLRGEHGQRLGRIEAVECCPDDAYRPRWFLLRLRGWRSETRAVPAEAAIWHRLGAVAVPYSRADILASPSLTRVRHVAAFVRPQAEHFYAVTGR